MVCLRNISVDTLHKGDTEDNNNMLKPIYAFYGSEAKFSVDYTACIFRAER